MLGFTQTPLAAASCLLASSVLAASGQSTPLTNSEANRLVLSSEGNWGQNIENIPPLVLPDGRLFVTVGDKIYMVGPDGKVRWSYSPGAPLTAQPAYRADRNELAIVGFDLTYQWLDADTGKVRWKGSVLGGRSTFVDVKPFGDGYLVKVYMGAYRDVDTPSLPDTLDYWVENDAERWSVDFPIGAELIVAGKHIYAVTFQEQSVTIQEIFPPAQKK